MATSPSQSDNSEDDSASDDDTKALPGDSKKGLKKPGKPAAEKFATSTYPVEYVAGTIIAIRGKVESGKARTSREEIWFAKLQEDLPAGSRDAMGSPIRVSATWLEDCDDAAHEETYILTTQCDQVQQANVIAAVRLEQVPPSDIEPDDEAHYLHVLGLRRGVDCQPAIPYEFYRPPQGLMNELRMKVPTLQLANGASVSRAPAKTSRRDGADDDKDDSPHAQHVPSVQATALLRPAGQPRGDGRTPRTGAGQQLGNLLSDSSHTGNPS